MPEQIRSEDGSVTFNLNYEPSENIKNFIEDSAFCTGLFGPLGTGKSSAGVIKAWLYAQAWPGARIAIIRDSYPALLDTTVTTFLEWLPENVAGTYAKSRRIFYLRTSDPNRPAEILFRAADDKDDVSNMLSLDLAAAFFDEPQGGLALRSERVTRDPGIDQELFRMVLSRVGRQRGYLPLSWMTGNPPSPTHWIAKTLGYSGVGEPTNPYEDFRLYLAKQEDNIHNLTPGYYDRLRRLFGDATPLARRFINGEWIEFTSLQPFQASWINYYDHIPTDGLLIKLGFDPAISDSPTSSRSAMVVAAQCRGGDLRGHVLILSAVAGHWTVYEQVDRILKAAKEYKVRTIVIEDVAYQRSLKEILEREMRTRGLMVNVELSRPDGDKLRRASAWSPFVEDGTILFAPNQKDLIDSMIAVPAEKGAWDLVDAAGMVIRSFVPMQGDSERIVSRDKTGHERATGYASDLHPHATKPKPFRPRPIIKNRAAGYTNMAGRIF